MVGFDDKALEAMLEILKSDDATADIELAKRVFNLAMTYDIDYMVSAGIIKEGEFTDAFYDDDDAYDFIIDRISNADPTLDGDALADMLDRYFDCHDSYMSEIGLLEWE